MISCAFLSRLIGDAYPLFIILGKPLGKSPEAFPDADPGSKSVVPPQGSGVGVGHRDVAGLHADQFPMAFKIIVIGENACADKFFLQCADIVQKVFRLAAADVIDSIRRDGQAVFTVLLFRCTLHDAVNAFHDIIDKGEVTAHVSIIEDLDRLSGHEFLCGAEIKHIRSAGRAVDCEEAKACRRDVVEFAVGMSQQLIALLGCCIQAYRVVYLVVCAERHLLVAAINRGRRCINQMFHRIVAAGLQDVVEADDIGFDVDIRMIDGIADACLGSQIDHDIEMIFFKKSVHKRFVADGSIYENMLYGRGLCSFFNLLQAPFLEAYFIVIVHVVQADRRACSEVFQQAKHEVCADKAGAACYQYGFSV